MAFRQVYNGGTYGPGATFQDGCEFEGCTFRAQCTFGKGCIFKNCSFVRCCYPYYRNPWSQVKESILEYCYLDYVVVDAKSLLKGCSQGSANVMGAQDIPGKNYGGKGGTWTADCCGQHIDSKSVQAKSYQPRCTDYDERAPGYHEGGGSDPTVQRSCCENDAEPSGGLSGLIP